MSFAVKEKEGVCVCVWIFIYFVKEAKKVVIM